MCPLTDDPHEPTPDLDDFMVDYIEDDNCWWTLSSGDHMNLFDAALDRINELQERNGRLSQVADKITEAVQNRYGRLDEADQDPEPSKGLMQIITPEHRRLMDMGADAARLQETLDRFDPMDEATEAVQRAVQNRYNPGGYMQTAPGTWNWQPGGWVSVPPPPPPPPPQRITVKRYQADNPWVTAWEMKCPRCPAFVIRDTWRQAMEAARRHAAIHGLAWEI